MTGKALQEDAGRDGSNGNGGETGLQRKGKNVRMNGLTTENSRPDETG